MYGHRNSGCVDELAHLDRNFLKASFSRRLPIKSLSHARLHGMSLVGTNPPSLASTCVCLLGQGEALLFAGVYKFLDALERLTTKLLQGKLCATKHEGRSDDPVESHETETAHQIIQSRISIRSHLEPKLVGVVAQDV